MEYMRNVKRISASQRKPLVPRQPLSPNFLNLVMTPCECRSTHRSLFWSAEALAPRLESGGRETWVGNAFQTKSFPVRKVFETQRSYRVPGGSVASLLG